MDKYIKELEQLKPHDKVQQVCHFQRDKGYWFLITAGHGYLVVPIDDRNIEKAKAICKYGFAGDLAYYLEEDCEAGQFIDSI